MGRAIMIIGAGALAVGVIIYSLIECAQSDKYNVRALPKGAWLLIILLLPVIGAVLWLFFGRPRSPEPGAEPQRGRGPDDDPQFLRNLEERRRQQEQARKLQEWENELKRTGRAPGKRPSLLPEDSDDLEPDDPRLTPGTETPPGGPVGPGDTVVDTAEGPADRPGRGRGRARGKDRTGRDEDDRPDGRGDAAGDEERPDRADDSRPADNDKPESSS